MCSEIGLVLKKIYQKVLTYIKESDKVSVRRKHLDWQGGKWKSIVSRKNSLSAVPSFCRAFLPLRQEDI